MSVIFIAGVLPILPPSSGCSPRVMDPPGHSPAARRSNTLPGRDQRGRGHQSTLQEELSSIHLFCP